MSRAGVLALLLATALSAGAGTFTVTSTADSGAGSLREAITLANADNAAPRVINFAIGTGVQTITLASALPQVAKATTINATTQPGFAGTPLIVIDGNAGDFDGLVINAFFTGNAANTSAVRGLCIVNCGTNGGTVRNGLVLRDADSVTVTGCYVGISAAGTIAARNTGAGIRTELAVSTIGGTAAADRCVISGNLGAGIDGQTDGSNQGNKLTVLGCYIGVAADGMTAVPNGGDGIRAVASVSSAALTIGSTTAGGGNVISNNGGNGVRTQRGSKLLANIIGLAADGATVRGNTLDGVLIDGSTSVLDGTTSIHNVISGNGGAGVRVSGSAANRSTIRNCYIGTDATGMLARGNGSHGVEIVAGGASVAASVISGNTGSGVRTTAGDGNITDNKIGVNADATAKLGNGGDGIAIENRPNLTLSSNTIGGNPGAGIHITGAAATKLIITGNAIGTGSVSGTVNLGNGGHGIAIAGGAQDAIIGAATALSSDLNQIVFNGGAGIVFPVRTRILFNRIHSNTGLALDRGGDGVDAPAPAGPGGGIAPRTSSNSRVNSVLITLAKINAQFFDRADLTFQFTQAALSGAAVRIFFYGTFGANRDITIPLGYADMKLDLKGAAEGAAEFVFSNPNITHVTGVAVTDVAADPSCTGESSLGVALEGTTSRDVVKKSTANHDPSGKKEHPIDTFSGELFDFESIVLHLGGPMPLFFARYYASMITSDGNITSALGRNRLHNFDAKLTVAGTNATAVLSTGRVVQFTRQGNAWVLGGRMDIAFQLLESGLDFILADPRSQRMWTFDATARLTAIGDGRGNRHTLSYTGSQLTSVSDGLMRTLTFSYDGNGHLATVTDGLRTVVFGYTGSDLTTATDPLGHTTSFIYDASGHLLSTLHPRGNSPLSQTYASERVASQTWHPATGDQPHLLSYDTNTRATTLTDPTGRTRTDTHTPTGELSAYTDEEGKTLTLGSDVTGRRNRVTDRLGRTTLIAYHVPSGKPSSITAPDGTVTSFTYEARVLSGITFYDLANVQFTDGTSRAFTYDAAGNPITAVDELGNTSTFSYDAHSRVLTAKNPTGGVATFTYDAKGNIATSKDSDTGQTTYTYDAFSRLTRVTHPDTTHTDIVYDDADRVTAIADERAKTFGYTYDANDNVTVITDPANATTHLGYDALDRAIQITDRLGKPSRRTFDSRNWISGVTDELNHTTSLVHDSRQRLSAVTNAGNETVNFGYNDEAELISMSDPLAHTTTLVRNQLGRVIAASDAMGHTVGVQRDALQRITMITDPIGRQTKLAYDQRSLLVGASRDGIGAASYTRDAVGRLTKIADLNHAAWNFAYTPAGRLSGSTDPGGNATGFAYDQRGRLMTIMRPEGGTCAVARNEAGDVTQLNYSGGPVLDFTYDALRRLTGASGVTLARDAEGRIINSQQAGVNFSATYDDAGRLVSVGYYNNSFVVTYTYDSHNRLVMVRDNSASGVNSVAFAYDAADRVTNMTRSNGVNAILTHDAADRLTRIQEGSFLDLKYAFNADGDVTATDLTAPLLPAVQTESKQFTFDAASQVKSDGFTYDARGRLTASPGHTFAWDGASRLAALDTTTLGYDGFGDVTTRTASGATTRLFYHHSIGLHPLVAERNESSNQFTRFYIWTPGGTLLYAIDVATGAPSFYHFDRVGSILALTGSSGTVTDSYAYSPYGEMLGRQGTTTQPFAFVGLFGVRIEGALYQMRARHYDPLTARFLSRDPAAPRLTDARTLDPYLYALGNPIRYLDRDGAQPDIFEALFKGLSGDPKPDPVKVGQASRAREAAYIAAAAAKAAEPDLFRGVGDNDNGTAFNQPPSADGNPAVTDSERQSFETQCAALAGVPQAEGADFAALAAALMKGYDTVNANKEMVASAFVVAGGAGLQRFAIEIKLNRAAANIAKASSELCGRIGDDQLRSPSVGLYSDLDLVEAYVEPSASLSYDLGSGLSSFQRVRYVIPLSDDDETGYENRFWGGIGVHYSR